MASSLVKKLRIQGGQRVLILNAPPGYVESLDDLPQGVKVSEQVGGTFDFVHLFVKDGAELDRSRLAAMEALDYDGLFWISYPKKTAKVDTDLTRDALWELMGDTGLRPVTQVSVDKVWSAMWFRPVEKVGK
jgi:hypothetical protein